MTGVKEVTEKTVKTNSKTPKSLLKRGLAKLIELAREKDPPHKVALGMGLGIFVGILPIMGIQMAVVALFALPLRGNLKAAIAGVWISNPITFIPMYWSYYRFGLLFTQSKPVGWTAFSNVITQAAEGSWTEVSASMFNLGTDILIPMWVGATILAVIFSIPTYFVTYSLVVRIRARRAARR